MNLNKLLHLFTPKDDVFFPLLIKISEELMVISQTLNEAVQLSREERKPLIEKISEVENNIDELTHQVKIELSRRFIAPFDREDIYELNNKMEDVADNIQGGANLMELYQVEKITKPIKALAEINVKSCEQIYNGIMLLKSKDHNGKLLEVCGHIRTYEMEADRVYDKAIQKIFNDERDALEVIKLKEVLSALESATDKSKAVSDILESIYIKHS